ncbi:branched-chain amino acid transaminase [bacterium]|nr:branched-chain amino acid transaminase [bacterium]
MQEYVFLDGNYIEKDKASLPIMTHAFLYGTSVFEGIRAYYNKEENQLYAFKVKEHFERLMRSAHVMHMKSPYTLEEYCELTKKLLAKNAYKEDVYIRPNLFKSAQKIGPSLLNNKDSFLLFTLPMGDYIDIENGLNVCVSSWRRNSDNAIPPRSKVAGAYVNTALIKSDAQLAGFDDAIVLDENGRVTEGSAMNLFLVQNGKLITSRTTDNILIGVTRNTVMQLAKEVLKLEVEEREVSRTELYTSDEAFYCGTGAQISPIATIDHRKLGTGEVGPIAKELQKLYFDVVKGRVDKYKEWCMPVYD